MDRRTLLFEIVVLTLAAVLALVLFALGAHLINRFDALQADYRADSKRWQTMLDRCTTDAAGAVSCPAGTYLSTTTTVAR